MGSSGSLKSNRDKEVTGCWMKTSFVKIVMVGKNCNMLVFSLGNIHQTHTLIYCTHAEREKGRKYCAYRSTLSSRLLKSKSLYFIRVDNDSHSDQMW